MKKLPQIIFCHYSQYVNVLIRSSARGTKRIPLLKYASLLMDSQAPLLPFGKTTTKPHHMTTSVLQLTSSLQNMGVSSMQPSKNIPLFQCNHVYPCFLPPISELDLTSYPGISHISCGRPLCVLCGATLEESFNSGRMPLLSLSHFCLSIWLLVRFQEQLLGLALAFRKCSRWDGTVSRTISFHANGS